MSLHQVFPFPLSYEKGFLSKKEAKKKKEIVNFVLEVEKRKLKASIKHAKTLPKFDYNTPWELWPNGWDKEESRMIYGNKEMIHMIRKKLEDAKKLPSEEYWNFISKYYNCIGELCPPLAMGWML